VSKLQQ